MHNLILLVTQADIHIQDQCLAFCFFSGNFPQLLEGNNSEQKLIFKIPAIANNFHNCLFSSPSAWH